MYSALPPRSTADSMASSAIRFFPEAVGTAATRLSPSTTPASTAAAWGGYSSATPSASSASPTPAGSPESELGCIGGGWVPTRFKPSERGGGGDRVPLDRRRAY